MKLHRVSLLFMMVLFALIVAAQETNKVVWSFNFGYKGLDPTLNEAWPIRQDVGYYNDNGFNSSVNLSSELNYFTISPEFSFSNEMFSISPGVRYTTLNTSIVKTDYDRGGYYFLRLKGDGSVTNYARVKAIREATSYLGVPLEIKYTPFNFGVVSMYVKLTGELGYSIGSSTAIEFKVKEMDENKEAVMRDLDISVNPLYAAVNFSLGARFKLNKQLYCSMDIFLPASYMTPNNSGLVSMKSISGVQLSIDIPF